jgi:hypothetical protein
MGWAEGVGHMDTGSFDCVVALGRATTSLRMTERELELRGELELK